MIGVFVVCATRLYRDGVARFVAEDAADVRLLGTAADGIAEVDRIRDACPDVVLVDVEDAHALVVVAAIREAVPTAKVIALALAETDDDLIRYAEAGISGYVSRENGTISDVVDAIRSAARGEMICSPRAAAALLRRVTTLAGDQPARQPARELTPRQLEIVRLLEVGLSNKEIAQRLHIELPTVKNHLHTIFEKLDVSRRTDAVARVRASGLGLRTPRQAAVQD